MKIGKDWTIFLDRDGVINQRILGGYVTSISEFILIDKTIEAIQILNKVFHYTFIVTNQAGVGKGLMKESDLLSIHQEFQNKLAQSNCRIDQIYQCTALPQEINNCRKPNPAMAYQAQRDFPEVELKKSFMVGDTASDMEFGRNIGSINVLIRHNLPEQKLISADQYDYIFDSLYEFAQFIQEKNNFLL